MCQLHTRWFTSPKAFVLLISLLLGQLPVGADEPKSGTLVLESKGYILPAGQVTVSPRVSGQVVELLIEEGKMVQAGEVLARLDPAECEASVRLARAELKLAEAGLASAKDAPRQADRDIAQAKVEVAQARTAVAQYRLDGTVVRAPVAGTVLVKRAEIGTLINPQGTASLCDMADLRTMEVEVWVQEKDLAKVAKGQSCLVRLEAFPHAPYRGHVARLLPIADRARAAVGIRVRLEVPDADTRLRPELSAIVQFLAKE